ncbi:MAG: T9SS C-terminal target domain-containing protein [Calditrichaeota bacterium]|nr:MAG: T9SS C-terminal target domain-containing protein [Calditrichota bacterium]
MNKILTKIVALFFFLLCSLPLHAGEPASTHRDQSDRGCTFEFGEDSNLICVGDAAEYVPHAQLDKIDAWQPAWDQAQLQETVEMDFYLPPQSEAVIHLDLAAGALNLIRPEPEFSFSAEVQAAIAKAPQWLENDLTTLFSHLLPEQRSRWADAILAATDPYIDEIAFCIAHLSPEYLVSPFASIQLLVDNARLIYENDKLLDYVQVIDVGTSSTDQNYYSTTLYRTAYALDTLEVEAPRDIYYWYVVHPKISDEIPAYIDPDRVEDNRSHRNNITAKEQGYFWRDFLFNYSDPGYARLKDLLKGKVIVWNKFDPRNQSRHAMETLNRWMDSSMKFDSNEERPHQPVRIYRKHMGRCGENSDMRVAVARAALIPAVSVASYSTDHVWNEFWDEEWIHWDGAINDPYMYVNSWGKQFGSVFRWKSDGSLIPVTHRYTKSTSILHIYVLDREERPIDGATVVLYTTGLDGTQWFDTYGVTDVQGKVTFVVGTDRPYYASMSCDYGNVPQAAGETVRVIGDSRPGIEYQRALTVQAEKPERRYQEAAAPAFSDHSFYFRFDFQAPMQITAGSDIFDDLDQNATQFVSQKPGKINYCFLDAVNYDRLLNNGEASGFNIMTQQDGGAVSFEVGGGSDWYFILDNSSSLHTLQHIIGLASLYAESDPTVPKVFALPCHPNPLNPYAGEAVFSYQLPQKTATELSIYNILGQRVRTLINQEQYAGSFQVSWDGRDGNGQIVPAGLYVYRIKTAIGESSQKLLVIH